MPSFRIGNFLKFVCFGCGFTKSNFIQSEKLFKEFTASVVKDESCEKCKGKKWYCKDQFGETIDINEAVRR